MSASNGRQLSFKTGVLESTGKLSKKKYINRIYYLIYLYIYPSSSNWGWVNPGQALNPMQSNTEPHNHAKMGSIADFQAVGFESQLKTCL